jgi:circadian clock protein KaiC
MTAPDVLTEVAPAGGARAAIVKMATGMAGVDAMTGGGLPENRLTVVVGATGSGKTVFTLQTVANRLAQGDACIFVAFEESADRILTNIASFAWGVGLATSGRFKLVEARMPMDAVVAGAFDLSGLLAGLSVLKEEIGARVIVFDAVDMLLTGLEDERLERQELARIDAWIRESDVSAMITVKAFGLGKRDQRRAEFLQYMADCVVVLSRTLTDTESSRTLIIEKYRGAGFSANPAPMVISRSGVEVVAIQPSRMDYPTFTDRVSTGVARLDGVMNGGYRRGSSVLVSGSPGTSKTTLGACFAMAACSRGEKALFVSFDESGAQIIENVRSTGIDLAPFVAAGLLNLASLVSTGRSPEEHFLQIRALLQAQRPDCLIIDPISSLLKSGYPFSRPICEALLDYAKSQGVTVLCTSLLDQVSGDIEMSASHVSTLADTWIHVSYVARDGERNRSITIIKSRGTAHSNQVRELVMNASGVDLVDVYVAEGEVLMGSARAQKEAEVARAQSLQDVATRLARIEMEGEIAELGRRVAAATMALEAKHREAEFMDDAERNRSQDLRAGIDHRLALRRTATESRLAALAQAKIGANSS